MCPSPLHLGTTAATLRGTHTLSKYFQLFQATRSDKTSVGRKGRQTKPTTAFVPETIVLMGCSLALTVDDALYSL